MKTLHPLQVLAFLVLTTLVIWAMPSDLLPAGLLLDDVTAGGDGQASGQVGHPIGGPGGIVRVLFGLSLILLLAKLSGHLADSLNLPSVLGELVTGIILGNLWLADIFAFEFLKHTEVLSMLAEIGVILLLFTIGLESNLRDLRRVGGSAAATALIGIVAPGALGVAVSAWFLPDAHDVVHLFVGATLCATSVGITAQVLEERGSVDTEEGRIILGAAVIDDVLGLIVLGLVTGSVAAVSSGSPFSGVDVLWTLAKVAGFFAFAVAVGLFGSHRFFRLASRLHGHGILLAAALIFCFGMANLASLVGLAPIVGAFCAGLALDEATYREFLISGEQHVEDLVRPLASVFVPVFFVMTGTRVDLHSLLNPGVLGFAIALTAVAIVGKQMSALGVRTPGANRLAVGVGMIPRGEVGLIFAGVGAGLTIAGRPIIESTTYAALIFMVMTTTLVTPPLLVRALPAEEGHSQPKLS